MPRPRRDLLAAVLDHLLPANGALPAAGELGLAAQVEEAVQTRPQVGTLLDELPDGFVELADGAQDGILRGLEQRAPASFTELVELVYSAYYTDQRVLEHIEQSTGYPARPPQPEGYELEPFDDAVLATIRRRGPLFRTV
jgi:hypothetical protein